MAKAIAVEVCVLGGGPAGSSLARKLAQLGHRVCLVEKAAFPRAHIGESLPPSILTVLDLLDLRSPVESAGFLRPAHAWVRWTAAGTIQRPVGEAAGFQVDRDRFDQILLSAAQAAGVQVLQPAGAGRPEHLGGRQWRIPVHLSDRTIEIQAAFVVDATGKLGLLPTGTRHPQGIPTLALYGYWQNADCSDSATRVEAGADTWFWGAPLPNGHFNAAVFLDRQAYAAIPPSQRTAVYRSRLSQTQLLHPCLAHASLPEVQICDATASLVDSPMGDDWIAIGDAAFSLDPLSSQGVQMAMMSAFQGSIAVHTLLTHPERSEGAIAFYQNKLQEIVYRNQRVAAQFYAQQTLFPASPFWQRRATAGSDAPVTWNRNETCFDLTAPVCLSQAASLSPTPVIQGHEIQVLPALHHPGLEQPVAYLGDVAIAPLLRDLHPPRTVPDLMRRWSQSHALPTCWQILQWLWAQHIVVNASSL